MDLIVYLLCFQTISARLQFPNWLADITNQSDWPATIVPYIPEASHDFSQIAELPQRVFGECHNVGIDLCSFDCHKCLVPTDLYTCNPLSQTFDDGPTSATPELLDQLKKAKTKTTFFLIGSNVVEYPEVVMREKKEGHLLAVHTWSHRFLPALANEEIYAELQWTIWAINASTGVVPKYFRPPYGGIDNRVRSIAQQLGLVSVLWDRDTADWRLNDNSMQSQEIIRDFDRWLEATGPPPKRWFEFWSSNPKPKGLVLEHDLSSSNVALAKQVNKRLRHNQKTVAQCAGMKWYQ